MKNILISKILAFSVIVMISTNVQAQFTGGSGRGDYKTDYTSCGTHQVPTSAGTTSITINHTDGTNVNYSSHYLSGACLTLANIADSSGGNILGSTTVTSTLNAAALQSSTDRVFAPRVVRVNPTSNGNVDMVLYYTQNDFNDFNSLVSSIQLPLPINSNDSANRKVNVKMYRSDSNSYESAGLTNVSATTTWDATNNLWKVTINNVSASGYYFLTTEFVTTTVVSNITHLNATVLTNDNFASTTVDWDNAPGATLYNIRYRQVGTPTWVTTSNLTSIISLASLSFNTTYEIQIQVRINNQIRGQFVSYTFTTSSPLPLCMPPTTTSHNVLSNNSATINWASSTYGVMYQVQYRQKNTLYWGGTSTAALTRTFNYMNGSTDYEYQVRTRCLLNATSNTWSSFSSIAKLTTLPNPPTVTCLPPTNVYTTINNANSVTLHWDTASNAEFYSIRTIKAGDTSWGGTSTSSNSKTLNYLLQNTKYYFKIRTSCLNNTTINKISDYTALDSFMTPFIKVSPSLIFNDVNAAWSIYPNPTQEVINIQFISPEDADLTIKVMDMTGRVVKTISTSSVMGGNLIDVNVAELINGVYTLHVIQKDKLKYVTKFNKQN